MIPSGPTDPSIVDKGLEYAVKLANKFGMNHTSSQEVKWKEVKCGHVVSLRTLALTRERQLMTMFKRFSEFFYALFE